MAKTAAKKNDTTANLGFETKPWAAADALRNNMDAAEYKHLYGTPQAGNANYAWVQHFVHHLAPTGLAGFVLANGSMSSNQSGEGEVQAAARHGRLAHA